MKKNHKKNPENSFEISKEMYIYTIAALFIISIIAGGIHWSRNFGFGPMMMQRQIYNPEEKLNFSRLSGRNLNAGGALQIANDKNGKIFSAEDINIDAVNSYFFNNIADYPPFNISDVKKIEYTDLNGDGQNEVLAVLNTKLSHLAEINKSEGNLEPENVAGETMVNIIGVFQYGAVDKTWAPLYLDFVAMPIYNENGVLPDGNINMPVLSRIEVTDRKYNSSESAGVVTEIFVEKKYAKDQEYKYKLIFNNLDLIGKEAEK